MIDVMDTPEGAREVVKPTYIVGLCGPKGCGKSTLAGILVHGYGCTRLSVAEPLRSMARCLGVSDEELPISGCRQLSGRQILQKLGTWVRGELGPEYLANLMLRRAADVGGLIVVDDVRTDLEAELIRYAGGTVIACGTWLENPEHWTEQAINPKLIDAWLPNLYEERETCLKGLVRAYLKNGY